MKKIFILFILLLSTSFSSLAWSSENYEDCIFKNMKGIGSDLGAKEIIDLCKAKHLREGNYKDGKRDGKWTHWYEDGLKWSEKNYKDGKQDGKSTEWFANGEIWTEKNHKDGMIDI